MQRGRELSTHMGKDAVAELTQMPGSFNGEAKVAAEDVLPPEFLEVLEISGTTENLSRATVYLELKNKFTDI